MTWTRDELISEARRLLEEWPRTRLELGKPLRMVSLDALALRYLDEYGPASIADVHVWSGLTRLREAVDQMPLCTFRGERVRSCTTCLTRPTFGGRAHPTAIPPRARHPACPTRTAPA
ncbi:DNA glycosylase AlkZ-like family protein [Actinomadura rudentiformis]|uniref:DNA glycosylase AlkZ-like family protein n=1 Tax=Actinomadura rudentiformis TaxID=359158 RepID=UPI001CEF7729